MIHLYDGGVEQFVRVDRAAFVGDLADRSFGFACRQISAEPHFRYYPDTLILPANDRKGSKFVILNVLQGLSHRKVRIQNDRISVENIADMDALQSMRNA